MTRDETDDPIATYHKMSRTMLAREPVASRGTRTFGPELEG